MEVALQAVSEEKNIVERELTAIRNQLNYKAIQYQRDLISKVSSQIMY